jgi:hypothetical protein
LTSREDGAVVGTAMAMAVVEDMDVTTGAYSSLELLLSSSPLILPALLTRALEGGGLAKGDVCKDSVLTAS